MRSLLFEIIIIANNTEAMEREYFFKNRLLNSLITGKSGDLGQIPRKISLN